MLQSSPGRNLVGSTKSSRCCRSMMWPQIGHRRGTNQGQESNLNHLNKISTLMTLDHREIHRNLERLIVIQDAEYTSTSRAEHECSKFRVGLMWIYIYISYFDHGGIAGDGGGIYLLELFTLRLTIDMFEFQGFH